MPGRNGALLGTEITLTVKFLDPSGNLADPDDFPSVDIFPPGKDPSQGSTTDADALILDASDAPDLGNPPGTYYVTRQSVGCYSYKFPIPAGGDVGIYFDRWTGTLTGQPLEETFMFVVVGGGSIATGQLQNNNRVTVYIDGDLLDADGNKLGNDFEYYFTTTYDPLYSSVRRMRLELGPLANHVPDDTINLALFEASLFADAITFANNVVNDDYFKFARREYVTCLAASKLLGNQSTQGKQKRLADLDVRLSGDPNDKIKDMMRCIAQYEPVIKSHGEIAAGTGLKPQVAVKGATDPDRPIVGRLWAKEVDGMPAANTKVKPSGKSRPKRAYLNRWGKSRWDWD